MPELVDSLSCPKCGGPLKLEVGEVIVTCQYCGTASRIIGDRPFLVRHGMLAHRLDRAGAEAAIAGWMEGGFLKPDDLREASHLESLQCVDVPFYVFEVDATTSYGGVLTRTGTNERRSGTVPRNVFWKILARRSGEFPVREYKIPLAHKVPFDTAGMVPGSRLLNAAVAEDEAMRVARNPVAYHLGSKHKGIAPRRSGSFTGPIRRRASTVPASEASGASVRDSRPAPGVGEGVPPASRRRTPRPSAPPRG